MFARTAETITQKLQENNSITSEQYEICRFGFQQGLTIILNAITTIAIGAITSELWQAILFMALYAPLRSNAGGYHARTSARCYVYSILLMVAVLLAMKHLVISRFICNITLLISCVIILSLAPVEDSNKPLDNTEKVVYRKRTYMITALECSFFVVALILKAENFALCIMWVFAMMGAILLAGKWKNGLFRFSNKVHNSERKGLS